MPDEPIPAISAKILEVKPLEKITVNGIELTVTSFDLNHVTLTAPEGVNIREGK